MEFIKIDRIGEVIAERIIENRFYSSWEDLESSVYGIGKEKIRSIKNRFKLG